MVLVLVGGHEFFLAGDSVWLPRVMRGEWSLLLGPRLLLGSSRAAQVPGPPPAPDRRPRPPRTSDTHTPTHPPLLAVRESPTGPTLLPQTKHSPEGCPGPGARPVPAGGPGKPHPVLVPVANLLRSTPPRLASSSLRSRHSATSRVGVQNGSHNVIEIIYFKCIA